MFKTNILTVANIITALRILVAPVFFFLIIQGGLWAYAWSLFVFGIAALTDVVDGIIARRLREVSEIGVFLDPLADKILVLSALLGFVWIGLVPLWMVIVIAVRDALATVLRVWSLSEGKVIQPSRLAKWKTAAQMSFVCCILVLIVCVQWTELYPLANWADAILDSGLIVVAMGVVTGLTAISLASYVHILRRLW